MTTGISSSVGIASGLQTGSIIEQLMSIEKARFLAPIQTRLGQLNAKVDGYSQYSTVVARLNTIASKLASGSIFGAAKASATVSSGSGSALLSPTADPGAAVGSYAVEVLSLAQAARVGSKYLATPTTALGVTGTFRLNGNSIALVAADTLTTLRDKINAANTGATPSGVSAALVTGTAGTRVILSATETGSAGIEMTDITAGTLSGLGLGGVLTTPNLRSDGKLQTYAFADSSSPIGTLLGTAVPGATPIRVNGTAVSINLGADSLDAIAVKLGAVAGVTASVVTETVNGVARKRLVTDATLAVDPTAAANGNRIFALLGTQQLAPSTLTQQRKSTSILTNTAAANANATGATLLSKLGNGAAAGVVAGDVITFKGTRADGTAFSSTLAVTAANTVTNLLTAINGATGLGAGSSPASVAIVNGQLVMTDSAGGASKSTLTVTSNNAGGGTLNFGVMNVTREGFSSTVATGSDALVRIDGTLISGKSNVMPDAITGVSLNLQRAEVGATSTVTVGLDPDSVVAAMKELVESYNAVKKFVDTQGTTKDTPFESRTVLASSFRTLTAALLGSVPSAPGAISRAGLAGVALDKTGNLALDETKFRAAFTADPAAVKNVFALTGFASTANLTFGSAGASTVAGTYAVNITTAAKTATRLGSAFATYADDATNDQLKIRDLATGKEALVTIGSGNTRAVIIGKLNAAFASSGVRAVAKDNGGKIQIDGTGYGLAEGFRITQIAGGANGLAQLGLPAGDYKGVDVAGTIDGVAALGAGQTLRGISGNAKDLSVVAPGALLGALGTVTVRKGVGQALTEAASALITARTGLVSRQQDSLSSTIANLRRREIAVTARLERRRESLSKQFQTVETVVARFQADAARLTSFAGMSTQQQA